MIVLHSVPLWLPGTSPWLWNLVRFLPPSVESHVAAERTLHEDRFPIARLHRFGDEPAAGRIAERALRKVGLSRHLDFVARTARSIGAVLIHSHWGDAGWRDVGAARAAGTRHVVSFYGKDVQFLPRQDPRWRGRYAEMFGTVDRVLCEGPHFAATIAALGCPESKISIQPLGVEAGSIASVPRRVAPGEPLAILVAASFREKKGIPDAIEAAGRLARSGVKTRLTLIGDASDDPRSTLEKGRIEEAIARHGDVLPVRRLGYQTREELLREAYDHHVLLSPSREAEDGDTEGGAPVVLVDAAATGMPIVATRHADIPAVVADGVTGLLAAEGEVDALSAMLRRIAEEPGLAEKLGSAGRARVESSFEVHVLGQHLAQIYEEVLGR